MSEKKDELIVYTKNIGATVESPLRVECFPDEPGRKILMLSWGNKIISLNMADENFEILAESVKQAWRAWTGI